MAKRVKIEKSGDSDELQALFDSVAGGTKKPHLEVVSEVEARGDSDDLQALFDSVAAQHTSEPSAPVARGMAKAGSPRRRSSGKNSGPKAEHSCDMVFNRIGHMTRQLHDTLRELGYDRLLEETAKAVPDARQRLLYIAQMTEQAASRVLNATDVAKPIQEALQAQAQTLGARWERLYRNELTIDDFKVLAADTRAFLDSVPHQTAATNAQLLEIMMAQDFQDLTGQVIKKIVDMAQRLESELLQVLLAAMPDAKKVEKADGLLNGPVVVAEGRTDVVTDQEQVDALLESLGF